MCWNCVVEEGQFVPVTDHIRRLARDAEHVNPFGPAHIVVDDNNLEDHHIRFCLEQEDLTEDPKAGPWLRDMLALTMAERNTVMGIYDCCSEAEFTRRVAEL